MAAGGVAKNAIFGNFPGAGDWARCFQGCLMPLSTRLRAALACALFALPIGCATTTAPTALPVTRWDHRPEAADWTHATLDALKTEGAVLVSTVPADVETFCPGYKTASEAERRAFWAGLFSSIAKYESTWNPKASGAGGRYLGLMQISPQTAQSAGCGSAKSELYDGANNLSCAVRIAARRAPAEGGTVQGRGALGGLTNDWGPMHDPAKRAEIANWTRAQSYCKA